MSKLIMRKEATLEQVKVSMQMQMQSQSYEIINEIEYFDHWFVVYAKNVKKGGASFSVSMNVYTGGVYTILEAIMLEGVANSLLSIFQGEQPSYVNEMKAMLTDNGFEELYESNKTTESGFMFDI